MTQRGITVTRISELVPEECIKCGCLFAMPSDFRERRLEDHGIFYCPNGHGQCYAGFSEAEWERKLRQDTEQRLASVQEDLRLEGAAHGQTKRELQRVHRRIHAGVCPHCKRTFRNVARHMQTKHKETP